MHKGQNSSNDLPILKNYFGPSLNQNMKWAKKYI